MILCSIETCALMYDGNNNRNITHSYFMFDAMYFNEDEYISEYNDST